MKKTILILFTLLQAALQAQDAAKPNILFIVVDDLNDYIEGFEGHPQIQTPNIKSIADNGYLFTNAFCNAPVCGPSRTSFLSGKDLLYTQVYDNNNYLDEFRDNFTEANNNEEVITLPEHLKDAGGYYTISVNKVFHDAFNKDFDNVISDPCLKTLSWSRATSFNDFAWLLTEMEIYNSGLQEMNWGILPDSLEEDLKDFRAVDTAIKIFKDIVDGDLALCDSAFFMSIGFDLPHLDLYVPEKYFPADYIKDFYADTFNIPYNYPADTFPTNGIIMPPQPEVRWNDYNNLGPLGKVISEGQADIEASLQLFCDTLDPMPVIDPGLSDSARAEILYESTRANAIMAYMAGIQFIDAQVGRLLEYLNSEPELMANTIIIFAGDNGFSFGEKHHWFKRSLWEPDVRVPFIIYDPKRGSNNICDQTVSLLDLYPTICELTGTPLPTFEDGSNYLDGKSIVPILDNPDNNWERPVLISFESEDNKEGSCFPQLAVRSEKFKYIRYASDGGDPYDECDADSSYFEEELYEIGKYREVDPYEWNNLITNDDYADVVEYLQQWLPDGPLYLDATYALRISDISDPCLYGYEDSILLHFDLFDTIGNSISPPPGFNYVWSVNLSDETFTGNNILFPFNVIDAATFNDNSEMLIYAKMVDTINNIIYALDTRTIQINTLTQPTISFNTVQIDDYSIQILDFSISGVYSDIWWDMGDGTILHTLNPGIYTYDSSGAFNITCYAQYGNEAECLISFSRSIISGVEQFEGKGNIIIYPNPASDLINIFTNVYDTAGVVFITDALGNLVYQKTTTAADYPFMQISTQFLPSGVYFLVLKQEDFQETGIFVVAQHN